MASETPGSTVSLVEQGSFLTKPSRHMVGCTGKESSTFTNPPDGLCPLCKNKGRSQVLKTYRINFTQSIFLCSDPQCIYPLGCTPLDNIITNTADLNCLSPNNQKKRNISELSSPSQSSAKKLKSDLPNLGQYSPVNASTSAQAESSTSVQIVPPWEHDTTSSGISQCAWTENTEVTKQNVPETSSEPSSPLPPHGLHYSSPGSSKLFTAGQDRLYEEPPPSDDIKMINKLTSTDADNNTSMRLSGQEQSENKEQSTPEPYPLSETPNSLNLVSENRFTLNGRSGILEDNEFSPGSVPSKDLPTLLHQHPLSLQMKDESTQEMCSKLSSGESAVPVCAGSLGDMESDQPCDFLQNTTQNLCESRESLLIPCADSVRNNTVALVDGSSAQDDQHRDLSHDLIKDRPSASSESPRLPVSEQDNKSEEILNQTSLKSLSEHPVEASAEENINNNPVGEVETEFTKSLHSKQDSCGTTSSSYSKHDIQPTCLSDNSSVDAIEPPCNLMFVMKAIEELTAAPLKLVEDTEKMHIETTPSCHSVEDIQPELALEVDSSLNLPAISRMTDSVVDCSSGVSSEEAHLSDQDDLAGGFQHSETTTTATLVQDILPELQPQEKCLSDLPLTPSTSSSTHIDKNSPSADPAEIILDTPMPERLDMIYSCQKSVCNGFMPSHSVVQVTETEKDDCSLIGLCNTDCPVSEKDDISTEQEIAPLPDDPLLGTKKLVQDSVEPCDVSTPPQDIQATITNQEHSTIDVASPNSTSALDDGNSAEIPASLPNTQIENNGNILTTSSQSEDQVEKEVRPLFDTVDAVDDIASRNQAASPLSASEESKRTVMKASFEDSVLPDLLLDIQPEHRMEEPLSAVPSPTCDADLNVTISVDCKLSEGHLLQVKLDKQSVQEVEMNKMEITNPEISSDELQNNISLSDTLSSEGTAHNESGLLDPSVTEQSQAEEIRKPRTFENSQRVLQWKNRKSLCWLDCILSALVQSKTIGVFVAKHGNNKESIIHNLFAKYDEATAMCKLVIKKNKAGRPTKAEICLHEVRMDIFDKLKPLLKCELGQKESPVFALPLLLRLDPEYQKLFAHSFTWNFKCESCGYTYQERCQKIMTTFTNIKEDWRPLNAAHQSPCNQCQAKNQRREMHLETLQPVFMLHFVEGLPSSDLKGYSFQFGEHWYEIKTVIRYRDQHFSTWMENDDDTWLESDDLKGTFCRRHQKFRMRAEDIHIVIWERSNGKNIQGEKPMPTSTVHVSEEKSENQISLPNSEISPSVSSMEFSLVAPEAKVSEPASTEYSPQVALASECSVSDSTEHPSCPVVEPNLPVPPVVPVSEVDNISNPLAGMESYADDDIITLTLVEIPFDSGGNPVDPNLSNPGVPQVEAALPETTLQPAVVEIQNTELTQHTGPGQSTRSDVAPSPVCSIQKIPVQPCQNKTSNLQPVAVATSTPSSKTFTTRKSVVDNMMGTLVKKDNFFINSNFSSAKKKTTTSKSLQPATLLKESELSGAAKKADSFEGFQAKTINNITNANGSSLLLSKLINNSSSINVPKEKPAPSVNSFLAPAALGHAKPGKNGLSYGKMLAKDGSLGKEDKVRRLRLKLLKKLKAKKNELAMLEKMAKLQQNGSCAGEMGRVQAGGVNRREHLRGFLQELQEQIDNVDTESIGTASSCTSICSSPGDAEFFAELFSPSPADHPENDSRFLEMLADGYGISADHNQQATGFHYPMNNTTSQATSGADSIPNTLNQSSSGGEESLNLLSSSTMAMLNDDTGYLDSFVDIF